MFHPGLNFLVCSQQESSLTFLFSVTFLFRSISPEVFHKKGFLKELAKFTGHSSAKSPVSESLFKKVAGLRLV